MNVETGELRRLMESEKPGPNEVLVRVGDTHDFMGCPCKIVHVNTGKGRITISPQGKLKTADSNPSKLANKETT